MSNTKNGKGSGRQHYTKEEKIAALEILREHEYNYVAASKALKITRETLQNWNAQYGDTIAKTDESLNMTIVRAKMDIQVKKRELIDKSALVLEKILDRINVVVEKENHLPNLIQAAEVVDNIINKPSVILSQNNQLNIFQGINNQLKGKIQDADQG